MKIYRIFIFITTAIVLFSMLEIFTEGIGGFANQYCGGGTCPHPCESTDGRKTQICGNHATCDKPGKIGAKCVCKDNWDGDNPDEGCDRWIG